LRSQPLAAYSRTRAHPDEAVSQIGRPVLTMGSCRPRLAMQRQRELIEELLLAREATDLKFNELADEILNSLEDCQD
jgi:hypothetical protein